MRIVHALCLELKLRVLQTLTRPPPFLYSAHHFKFLCCHSLVPRSHPLQGKRGLAYQEIGDHRTLSHLD